MASICCPDKLLYAQPFPGIMPERANIIVKVPKGDYGALGPSDAGVPFFVLTSDILLEAFKYLIKENEVGVYPPMYLAGTRLERKVGLAGPKVGNVMTIDTLLFPSMLSQTATEVAVDNLDYWGLILDLRNEGRIHHGSIHNHNSVHGYRLNPTPPDLELHNSWEKDCKTPQLTVIASEDGHFGFWRPSAFEVIVDGQKLPMLIGPKLRENIRHYQLESSHK